MFSDTSLMGPTSPDLYLKPSRDKTLPLRTGGGGGVVSQSDTVVPRPVQKKCMLACRIQCVTLVLSIT
jgi:hypothetical protein